jgi:transcriptional regulator with XRE-family HTH domain
MGSSMIDEHEMFGERLKRLREGRQLSQRQLADKVGITHGCVWRLERCDFVPKFSSIIRLASVLRVTTDYLLTGRESAHIAALHRAIRIGASQQTLLGMIGEQRT